MKWGYRVPIQSILCTQAALGPFQPQRSQDLGTAQMERGSVEGSTQGTALSPAARSYTALGLVLSSGGTAAQVLLLALALRRGRLGVSVAPSPGQPCCSRMSMHSWLPARRA